MEVTLNTKAIVLSRKPFNEVDEKIIFYSLDFGRLELVGRGTKKFKSKFSGHLEPLNLVNLMIIKGKQYDYVGTALVSFSFGNIKNNLEKIKIALNFFSWILKLVKNEEGNRKIFNLLTNFLFLLENLKDNKYYKFLLNLSIIKLLAFLGYLMDKEYLEKNKSIISADIFRKIYSKNLLFLIKNLDIDKINEKALNKSINYIILKYL